MKKLRMAVALIVPLLGLSSVAHADSIRIIGHEGETFAQVVEGGRYNWDGFAADLGYPTTEQFFLALAGGYRENGRPLGLDDLHRIRFSSSDVVMVLPERYVAPTESTTTKPAGFKNYPAPPETIHVSAGEDLVAVRDYWFAAHTRAGGAALRHMYTAADWPSVFDTVNFGVMETAISGEDSYRAPRDMTIVMPPVNESGFAVASALLTQARGLQSYFVALAKSDSYLFPESSEPMPTAAPVPAIPEASVEKPILVSLPPATVEADRSVSVVGMSLGELWADRNDLLNTLATEYERESLIAAAVIATILVLALYGLIALLRPAVAVHVRPQKTDETPYLSLKGKGSEYLDWKRARIAELTSHFSAAELLQLSRKKAFEEQGVWHGRFDVGEILIEKHGMPRFVFAERAGPPKDADPDGVFFASPRGQSISLGSMRSWIDDNRYGMRDMLISPINKKQLILSPEQRINGTDGDQLTVH